MSDQTAIMKELRESVRYMRHSLWLNAWTINLCFRSLPPGVRGLCEVRAPYLEADITIDPNKVESVTEGLDVLRHEMLHLHHSDATMVQDTLSKLVDDGLLAKSASHGLDVMLDRTMEQVVNRFESLFDYYGLTPKRLVARARSSLGEPRRPRARSSARGRPRGRHKGR